MVDTVAYALHEQSPAPEHSVGGRGTATRRIVSAVRRKLYRKFDTRSASSRMTRALSDAGVPVGSPLYRIRGFDQ
jgi:hypothetical protein